MAMSKIAKAITAVVVPVVAFFFDWVGVAIPTGWEQAFIVVATPFFVWLIPNG